VATTSIKWTRFLVHVIIFKEMRVRFAVITHTLDYDICGALFIKNSGPGSEYKNNKKQNSTTTISNTIKTYIFLLRNIILPGSRPARLAEMFEKGRINVNVRNVARTNRAFLKLSI
jgi:hypothetical protein